MSRLQARVIRLEASSRHGWRSYIGRPSVEWPDEALLGFLGESEGWPQGYEPTDDELLRIAAGWGCEE